MKKEPKTQKRMAVSLEDEKPTCGSKHGSRNERRKQSRASSEAPQGALTDTLNPLQPHSRTQPRFLGLSLSSNLRMLLWVDHLAI
jgi:hypothetical protein